MGKNHKLIEILSQILGVNMDPPVLHGEQPKNLNIQIIIRKGLPVQIMGIISNIIFAAFPFHRHSQRSAYIFSHPAPVYFTSKFFFIHILITPFISFPGAPIP